MSNNTDRENNTNNTDTLSTGHNVIEVPTFLLVFMIAFLVIESAWIFVIWKQRQEQDQLIAANNAKITALEHRADSLELLSTKITKQKQGIHDTLLALKHTRDSVTVGLRSIPVDSLCRVFMHELDKADVK